MLQRENVRFRASENTPNPLEVDYWINLKNNKYGGEIYYFNNLTQLWQLIESSGGGGTTVVDYNRLHNKPTINGTELRGDLSLDSIGINLDQYSTITWVSSMLSTKVELSYADDTYITKDLINSILVQINNLIALLETISSLLTNKVDKVSGKLLSTNDFTTAEKTKLSNLKNYDDTLVKADILNIRSSIPTKISQLANDSQYTTKTYVDDSISDLINSINEMWEASY